MSPVSARPEVAREGASREDAGDREDDEEGRSDAPLAVLVRRRLWKKLFLSFALFCRPAHEANGLVNSKACLAVLCHLHGTRRTESVCAIATIKPSRHLIGLVVLAPCPINSI